MMKKTLIVLNSLILLVFLAAWAPKEANDHSNETNLLVGTWCSGTVIDKKERLIATANHCVELLKLFHTGYRETFDDKKVRVVTMRYKPVEVTLNKFDLEGNLYSKSIYTAEVVGIDVKSDIAILKVFDKTKFFNSEARLSFKPVKKGDVVYAIGNPLGFEAVTTPGIISKAKLHFIYKDTDAVVIVFTAMIAPGSSGGALYNDNGEYIGMTNWGLPGGPYMASPASNIRNLLIKLRYWGV